MINGGKLSAIMNLIMLSQLGESRKREYNWKYIEAEYKLIKQKKSCLSRRGREEIVSLWEGRENYE